jgi:hypothetical protein
MKEESSSVGKMVFYMPFGVVNKKSGGNPDSWAMFSLGTNHWVPNFSISWCHLMQA